ncbi:DUF695 domain-containing protein [Spirillospora sp. NPDC052269]
MGIFRRPRETPSAVSPAISEFWEWWARARPDLEGSLSAVPDTPEALLAETPPDADSEPEIPTGLSAEIMEELSRRVARIHSELQWEIGGMEGRPPSLTVSGAGDPELRGLAERWYRAAPQGDAAGGWQFHPARPADPEMLGQELQLGDHDFDLEYVRFGMRADQFRGRVDITAYHPDFLFVSEEHQVAVAFHVLHWALGEDDVARWVGEVTISAEEPVDSLPPAVLPAVVEQIVEDFREPTWLSGEGRTPRGHPAQFGIRFPVHRQDHPLADLHVEVSVPYQHANPDRLPVEPSASALRKLEKKIDALPEAVLVVRQTGDGLRVFHLYADPDSGVLAELDQLTAGWAEGKAKVASTNDPGWRALAPFQP